MTEKILIEPDPIWLAESLRKLPHSSKKIIDYGRDV